MIQQFEGFFKTKGTTNVEGTSQIVTSKVVGNSSTYQTDGHWVISQNSYGGSSFQFPEAPVQDKLVVGIRYKAFGSTNEFGEIGAGETDAQDRSQNFNYARTLPNLPTLVFEAGALLKLVKPGSLVRSTPVEEVLASFEGVANVLRSEFCLEIEYAFAENTLRAYLNGALVMEVDYEFTVVQKTTAYRPTFASARSGTSSALAYLYSMFYATEPVGNFNVVRLLPNADGPSVGFPDGDKHPNVISKTSGLVSSTSASIEFGLQDLPVGATPMAVMLNASVSAAHKSANTSRADVRILANGDSVDTPVVEVPRNVNGHVYLVKELPTQADGAPWTENDVNSLTVGMDIAVTNTVGEQVLL